MPDTETTHNQPAYSITEISSALKRVVEDNFGHVRVRGEISGWKLAASGHAYLRLKDAGAVLDAVCWKGVMAKLSFRPEEGMEVLATGRVTTYPGRSNYQLVIDYLEPAGAGALMALLEKRKAMLAAEGLFAAERKRALPFMPRVIGVVTSPTGAVIRDILHRIAERFPCHVLVWPVLVQGEGAARQIAQAIDGFNALPAGDAPAAPDGLPLFRAASLVPRPDLLIVARGGGSLEDLWVFNEEIVVRAAANSQIPLISAVGHETDTTLIDYASDHRAPTPTASAERAVPVREEWLYTVREHGQRLLAAKTRGLQARAERLEGLVRGLTHPRRLVETAAQRLDDWSERLETAAKSRLERSFQALRMASVTLQPPRRALENAQTRLNEVQTRLNAGLPLVLQEKRQALALNASHLRPAALLPALARHQEMLEAHGMRLRRLAERSLEDRAARLARLAELLESVNPTRILERGFVLVRGLDGKLITRAAGMNLGHPYVLQFADGTRNITSN